MKLLGLFFAFSLLLTPAVWSQATAPARVVAQNLGGTAAPRFPRYVVVDLGAGMNPLRVRNNGWVLMYDGDGNAYRWKGGTLETLTTSDPNGSISIADMNNQGVVVGEIDYNDTSLNAETRAGMRWDTNSSVGVKISSPAGPQQPNPLNPGGTLQAAYFSSVCDNGDIYGQVYTGGTFVWTIGGDLFSIFNAYKWTGGTSGSQLSNCVTVPWDPEAGNHIYYDWANPEDTVTRANSSGTYIGGRISPGDPAPMTPNQWRYRPGTPTGLLNGQVPDFFPVALNEASVIVGGNNSGGLIAWTPSSEAPIGLGNAVAVNAATRQMTDGNGNQTQIPAAQVLGYDPNNLPTLWELAPSLTFYVQETLSDLLPANSGWTLTSVADTNDQGAIVGYGTYQGQGHGFLLLPVTLLNLADPYRGIASPSNPGHNGQNASIIFKANSTDTGLNSVAWIAAHDPNNNNAPRMPQFVASIAAMNGVIVNWQLNVTFHDRNNYPHRDFDTGDPNNANSTPYLLTDPIVSPTSYTANTPDVVIIPAPTNSQDQNGQTGYVEITDGTPWNIYNDPDWLAAVGQGYFGGDAVLSVVVMTNDGNSTVLAQQDFQFRIAGENPDPTLCKNYLVATYGGPTASGALAANPHAWFSWAIAKDETQGEGSRGYYNHFLNNGGRNASLAGHEGVPNWHDDGTHTSGAQTDRLTGSGGFGLFQLTYDSRNDTQHTADTNYIMPRDWIWNWQSNSVGFGVELQGKIAVGQALYNALTSTYPNNGPIPNYGNFPGIDAIIVTEYNGMYGPQMKNNKLSLPGYSRPQNSCWQPSGGSWSFLQNVNNYAQNVNAILNGQ